MARSNEFNGPGDTRRLVAPELLAVLDFLPSFDFNEETLRAVRAGTGIDPLKRPPLSAELQAVTCEQRFIPGPPGEPDVRVLVYTPPGQSPVTGRSAYLHIHGGGYVIGTPEISDGSNRSIAAELQCVVVSVDYRLAPETRFPGALEDCYAALMWLHAQAEPLGIDPSRVAIGGESAGGGHAAALAIIARNRGAPPIRLQLLDSPMLDDRTGNGPDPHPFCGELVWTRNSNRFGWRSLLGVEPGGPDVPIEAVPARVVDMTGLAPAFIVVGALDLFLEESLEYARRLTRVGVPAELHVIPGAFHGFSVAGGAAPQVQACMRLSRDALARALAPDKTSG